MPFGLVNGVDHGICVIVGSTCPKQKGGLGVWRPHSPISLNGKLSASVGELSHLIDIVTTYNRLLRPT